MFGKHVVFSYGNQLTDKGLCLRISTSGFWEGFPNTPGRALMTRGHGHPSSIRSAKRSANGLATPYGTSRGKGERVGNIEFGYRLAVDGVHVEPDPAEQAALSAIRSLRSGGHNLRAVAGALNEGGHRTRRGTQWRLESVVRAINQDAAKGQRRVA